MKGQGGPVFLNGGRPLQSRGCVGILLRGRGFSCGNQGGTADIRLSLFFPGNGGRIRAGFFLFSGMREGRKRHHFLHGHSNRWSTCAGYFPVKDW